MKFIDYGIGFILGKLFTFTGNYGISIILLTILVKAIIYPLTASGLKSSKKMQEIQPKIEELQTKYKAEPEVLNEKLMALYAENKINPVAGCLPMLIQLPIIFALFAVLKDPAQTAFGGDMELAKAATSQVFLWVNNLAEPDTIANFINADWAQKIPGILPILAAGLTYLQMDMMPQQKPAENQKQNSQTQMVDSMNKNMKIFTPVMILMSGYTLSAGVALYWVVSTFLGIVQQKALYTDKADNSNTVETKVKTKGGK